MTQTTDAALVERLRKRDREWQAKVDGWVKQAAEAGYAIKPDEEAIMRDTPGDRQAADTIEAQARRIEALEGAGAGEPIVPPVNGETDPAWAAIRRGIDQFAGRTPTISKHRAVTIVHLAAVVARLDAAGDKEAADTIVWQTWWRALDRERERFLLAELTPTVTP